jgi:hypothetical protein
MQRHLGISAIALVLSVTAWSQSPESKAYTDFPIIISIQFHAFSLPFRDMRANFSNIGIGIGTEVSLNGKPNWVHQVNVLWYHNKAIGNGLLFYSQNVWRPEFATSTYAEIKGGVGYLHSFRPVKSYKQINGEWISVGHKGKGLLAVPVGVSLGYDSRTANTYLSTFATYQFMLLKGYNKSIPIVPETLIQIGTRIH